MATADEEKEKLLPDHDKEHTAGVTESENSKVPGFIQSPDSPQLSTEEPTTFFCHICSIAFGICSVAICVSILAVNWTQMIYKSDESKIMVLVTLLILCIFGIGCIILAWISKCKCFSDGYQNSENNTDSPQPTDSPSIKLTKKWFTTFGIGDIIRCIFYIVYHEYGSNCSDKKLGITFNVFSILFSGLLIIFLMSKPLKINNFLRVGILVASINRWLDTILSDSQGVFLSSDTNHTDHNNDTNKCSYDGDVKKIVHYADVILAPATVEFTLTTIELLFMRNDSDKERNMGTSGSTNMPISNSASHNACIKLKNLVILAAKLTTAGMIVVAGVSFIFSIITDKGDSKENYPIVFKIYVSIQSVMKIIMFLIVSICLVYAKKQFSLKLGIGNVVLSISCFGNIVYHMFYCFALYKETEENKTSGNIHFINLSWTDNIVSILLAFVQTWLILGIHENEDFYKNEKYEQICFLSYLVGILNIGLWGSDSLGEARFPDLSIIIKKRYTDVFWNVLTKLILPLTIFFRFHTGQIQVKMYGDFQHRSQNADTV